MPIHETFSGRRDQAAKAGAAEIYAYDVLPPTLINQIVMIWRTFFLGTEIGGTIYGAEDVWAISRR